MQHYLHYGYGFPSTVLTKEEFKRAEDASSCNVKLNTFGLMCVEFTEGDCEHGWACIVLYPMGEVNDYSKMLTMTEINAINAKYGDISIAKRDEFFKLLKTHNLEHYTDKVELVFYSENY